MKKAHMKIRRCVFPVIGFLALAFFLPLEIVGAASLVQNFESAIADGWKAGDGGDVAVTSERFKSGAHCLRWNWRKADATLTFDDPASFMKRTKDGAFGLWVYNEKPLAAPMRADLVHGTQVVAACWFWMDYKGWRPLGALYSEIGCKPDQAVDGIRFHAPDGMANGELFLDYACFNFKPASIFLTHSYQMPWSGHANGLLHPNAVTLGDADPCRNRPWLPTRKEPEAITAQERGDMAVLAERLLPSLTRPAKGLKAGVLEGLRVRMAEYRIRRDGDKVTGRPVDGGSLVLPDEAVNIWDYLKSCSDVQKAYFNANEPAHVAELKQMFADLAAHFLDQGWAEGTQLGGWGNYPGPGLESFFLMRDVLAEAGLAREVSLALADHLACQGSLQYFAEQPRSSMDGLGFWNNQLLPCLLLLPDESERLQHLRAVQRFYDLALTNPDCMGPDGCSYHHGGFHFAYASYNLPRLMSVLEKTSDTDFRMGPAAHERLKTYVHAIAFTLSGGEQAYNLGMRAGTPLHGNMGSLAKTLAMMGTPDGKQKLDPEMAALYLTQTDQLEKEPAKTWLAQGIQPLPLIGHLTMNGAPLAVHRRADWLVAIAGISKFWRGLEIYGWTQSNNYGRYARNGSVCLVACGNPPSLAASGWSLEGWDWCHFPGTTALERPSREIFDGYAMYGNSSAFAGGTQLGDDGVWGMDFSGGDDVNFKKSVFCFGSRITVVTSDIHGIMDRPNVTTLFQNTFQPSNETVCVDGDAAMDFPLERKLTGEKTHWLMDNKGTGYFIPSGHDPIRLACRRQEWTYMISKYLISTNDNPIPATKDYQFFASKKRDMQEYEKHYRPSAGDFALAWFDHGKTPANASCAYTMVVHATPDQMKAFAADVPSIILQQDAHAHVVIDKPSQTTGYVLFGTNKLIAADGLLRANNQPCFVMVRRDGPRLQISVSCTDIKRTEPIRLKIKGTWKLNAKPAEPLTITAAGGDTQIEAQPDYYMPMHFKLEAEPNAGPIN